MTVRIRRLLCLPMLLASSLLASPIDAATCSVSTTGVGFGSYDPLHTAAVPSTGTIDLTCDASVSAVVSLSTGSGSYVERHMMSGSAVLTYNLYTSSAATSVWGDGTQGSSSMTLSGSAQAVVYGIVPAGQNPTPGEYSDSIVVEVAY